LSALSLLRQIAAYDLNTPAAIPPGSLLVFDIELAKIDAAAGPGNSSAGGPHAKLPKS
jgi:hypothetical protein